MTAAPPPETNTVGTPVYPEPPETKLNPVINPECIEFGSPVRASTAAPEPPPLLIKTLGSERYPDP